MRRFAQFFSSLVLAFGIGLLFSSSFEVRNLYRIAAAALLSSILISSCLPFFDRSDRPLSIRGLYRNFGALPAAGVRLLRAMGQAVKLLVLGEKK
jgi:hypothetical protein